MTPTQAGALVTPPQGAAPHTGYQGGAHQVPFNLDDAPTDLGPAHVYFNDLGEPYDPAAAEAAPPPAQTVVSMELLVQDLIVNSLMAHELVLVSSVFRRLSCILYWTHC